MSYGEKKFVLGSQGGNNAPFPLHKDEKLVTCPYDSNHRVLDTRAHIHFTNCNRKHIKAMGGNPQFKICIYSRLHHIRNENYEEHLKACPANLERLQAELEVDTFAAPKFYTEPEPQIPRPKHLKEAGGNKASGQVGKWEVDEDDGEDYEFAEDDGTGEELEEDWESPSTARNFDYRLRQKQLVNIKQPIGLTKTEKKERMEKIVQSRREDPCVRYAPRVSETAKDDWH